MIANLDQIVGAKRRRIAEDKCGADLRKLERLAEQHSVRGFRYQLEKIAASSVAVIAELKKASPSKGLIRADFDPGTLAKELQEAGAAALSVLTDEEFFDGSLKNLLQASTSTRLPCLRKDFIVDEFQVLEARANRADAVLLIVAVLPPSELSGLAKCARELRLDVLCEVHDEQELKRAGDAGCDLIGVNSRDLRTFQVDLERGFGLANVLPRNGLRVAGRGIRSGQ